MAQYSIGQVEKITGVKQHVLRYWEEIVLRLKYLIYVKKFTIEGAKNQIIEDAENVQNNPDAVMEIRKIRADLSELFFEIQKAKRQEEN